jgi:hypothetical protein
MGPSTKHRVSMTSLPFLQKGGGASQLLLFFLVALSCLSYGAAAPTDSEVVNLSTAEKRDTTGIEERRLPQSYDALLPKEIEDIVIPRSADDNLEKRSESAGLFWGPVYIGNLKLDLTNPHRGYAGPKFEDEIHINFHVYEKAVKNSYRPVVNLHIVKYSTGGKSCLYMWDSVNKTIIFDNCFDDFSKAIPEGVQAAKSFVDSLLRNADLSASAAILAALVVAMAAVLVGLGVVAVA